MIIYPETFNFTFRQSLAPLDIHMNQWTVICVLMHINNIKRIINCVMGESFEVQSNSITFSSHRVTINTISRQSLACLSQTLEPSYKQQCVLTFIYQQSFVFLSLPGYSHNLFFTPIHYLEKENTGLLKIIQIYVRFQLNILFRLILFQFIFCCELFGGNIFQKLSYLY